MRSLLGAVLANSQPAPAEPVAQIPVEPFVDPVAVPLLRLGRRDEELHLHLLELAQPEEEVAGRDLVAEGLAADLRDAERRLAARELRDVLEVDEDPLRGLGAEVRGRAAVPEDGKTNPRRRQRETIVSMVSGAAVSAMRGGYPAKFRRLATKSPHPRHKSRRSVSIPVGGWGFGMGPEERPGYAPRVPKPPV